MQSSRVRLMLVALFAMFAFGAVGTAVAQATEEEAPFWSIEGTRLAEGKTHYISAKATKSFVLSSAVATIECSTLKLKEGVLLGSNAGNEGKNNEIIEFGGGKTCSVTGPGVEECEVIEPIVTNPILSELVYILGNKEKTPILTLFKPATGKIFATLKFKGKKCPVETAVEGESLGEIAEDKENTGKSYLLRSLGAEQPEKVLLVKNKISEEVTVKGLAAFGKEATLAGTALILLAKKNEKGEFETELKSWSALV